MTVLSSEEETKSLPSDEKLTDLTAPLWALIVEEWPSIELVHSLIVSSLEQEAIMFPDGEKLISRTGPYAIRRNLYLIYFMSDKLKWSLLMLEIPDCNNAV